jgi:hypothetical protein
VNALDLGCRLDRCRCAENDAFESNQLRSEWHEEIVGRTTARNGLRVWGTDVTGRTEAISPGEEEAGTSDE